MARVFKYLCLSEADNTVLVEDTVRNKTPGPRLTFATLSTTVSECV